MNGDALARALAALGCVGRVEVRGKVALFITPDARALADPRLRGEVLQAAADHGFTSIAVELDEPADPAAVHRPQSSA